MRTDCNKPIVQFTPLARRQVLAEFDAGSISSDGGVLLLREVDRRINLLDRVDQLIPDPRDPLHIEHDQRTLLAQRVLAIACGWEDLNDHATLRNDLVLQLATNRKAIGSRGDVDDVAVIAGHADRAPLALTPPTNTRRRGHIRSIQKEYTVPK